MKQLDANTLVAYADGELDIEAVAFVEQELATDSDAEQVVRVLRDMGALVRAAHNSVVHENVPDRLVDVIMEAPETDIYTGEALPERLVNVILDAPESQAKKPAQVTVDDGQASSRIISMARRRSVAAFAMAAAVASVLIGGTVFLGHGGLPFIGGPANVERASVIVARTDPLREAAFQEALGTKKSNDAVLWINPETGLGGAIAPVKTYRRGDGTYCRVFQSVETGGQASKPTVGVACREPGPDGRWITSVEAVAGSGTIPYNKF